MMHLGNGRFKLKISLQKPLFLRHATSSSTLLAFLTPGNGPLFLESIRTRESCFIVPIGTILYRLREGRLVLLVMGECRAHCLGLAGSCFDELDTDMFAQIFWNSDSP